MFLVALLLFSLFFELLRCHSPKAQNAAEGLFLAEDARHMLPPSADRVDGLVDLLEVDITTIEVSAVKIKIGNTSNTYNTRVALGGITPGNPLE